MPILSDSRGGKLSPIDAFIATGLEKEGLGFSEEADRRTLLRRLSYDLTGLPPESEWVRAFLDRPDSISYETLVEGLLASPAFGERMAVSWLDLVRYADTVGFHGDSEYSVWPYRDYVIHAFNSNMPFDRFTREQLGGDLLPQASEDQKIASGYNRLNRISAESGVQDKEYRLKYAADRVRTTATAWMGATLACAECHDHKWDPYSAQDFYRFAAFFADLDEQGYYEGGFERGDWGPQLSLPSSEQRAKLLALDAAMAESRSVLDAVTDAALAEGRERWQKAVLALDKQSGLGWNKVRPIRISSSGGADFEVAEDSSVLVSGRLAAEDDYTVVIPAELKQVSGLLLEVLKSDTLAGNEIARAGSTFYISELEVSFAPTPAQLAAPVPVEMAWASAEFSQPGHPILAALDHDPDTSWSVGSGQPKQRRASFVFARPLHGGPGAALIVRILHERRRPGQHLGRFSLALASVERPSIDQLGLPGDVLTVLQMSAAKRVEKHLRLLTRYYRAIAPELDAARGRLNRLTTQRDVLSGCIPTMLVARATSTPRPVRVLPRGNWMDDSGKVVKPAVPEFFRQLATEDRIATRLDLADWLVARDNPLTARVFVNRLWKMFFGAGLVRTLDDLGMQGERPTYPELLDWLACEFMEPGAVEARPEPAREPPHPWDIKHIVRLIVTSRGYRQSSLSSPLVAQRDPANRWIARQSSFRLDAEMIRDRALAVSGLLNRQVGGPSVRPYQPEGYYASLHFPRREYVPSQGPDLYRRTLYTHWQRTFLHPALLAFDAPSREECTVERPVSNTPLQALVLLNDPTYVEAARVFAECLLRRSASGFEERLGYAFAQAFTRAPRAAEVHLLEGLYERQLARFRADLTAARQLAGTGTRPVPADVDLAELGAWTAVTRALLNLHEGITRY
ncbi:MAG TPA: DUF1549 and DUF1553 domain-containing protein [Verrucomicrobiae bacterium]|nr:DUF1549 and DUF1553 domain-containing protein [Verrucomicrobiae bacterium]